MDREKTRLMWQNLKNRLVAVKDVWAFVALYFHLYCKFEIFRNKMLE